MNNKSSIQLYLEQQKKRETFEKSLFRIMENSLILDNIFIQKSENGEPVEPNKGYFVIEDEFMNLIDAVRSMKANQGIRIIENKEFWVGSIYDTLSSVPVREGDYEDNEIIDLGRMVIINKKQNNTSSDAELC